MVRASLFFPVGAFLNGKYTLLLAQTRLRLRLLPDVGFLGSPQSQPGRLRRT